METKPLHTLAFCFGRRLADKKLNIGHIVGVVCKNFYKTKFHKNLDGTFNSADLMACDNRKCLECMRQIFANQQHAVIGQRDKVELEQQENIQRAVLHLLQQQDFRVIEKCIFELHVVIFVILGHGQNSFKNLVFPEISGSR